jgi:glutamine synthetase
MPFFCTITKKIMESLRFKAIHNLTANPFSVDVKGSTKITQIFGENVFTLKTAREYLSDEAYKSLLASIKSGSKIDRKMGDQISAGLKGWAEKKRSNPFYALVSTIDRSYC